MERQRQIKIASVIQKELSVIFNTIIRNSALKGVIISVTKISLTTDYSIAKVYLSIFPSDKSEQILHDIQLEKNSIKHALSKALKDQFRKLPELRYYIDDSLDYTDSIEKALKGEHNPIYNPDLLKKRKKN